MQKRVLLILLILTLSAQSYARLGERVSTAELAQSRLSVDSQANAKSRSAKVMVYDVRESTVDGIAIKEFFSNDGIIFAVSWRGVAHPKLSDLLGSYFPEYDKAAKVQLPAQRRGKSGVVSADQIIVRKFGHMRDIRGVATVPALMPAGVLAEELK